MSLKKKHIKNAMATVLTASMLIGSMGISFAANFSDIENHWAANQIKRLVDKGIASGYQDGSFKPNNHITRAEFITLVNKAFNISTAYDINYTDVSSKDWFYEEMKKAKGYMSGYEDNTIRPNNKITRQEVAVIMAKVLKVQSVDNAQVANKFKDADKIANWAKPSVGTLVNLGSMNGYPDGSFAPDQFITRGEAVAILDKAFTKKEEPVKVTNTTEIISGNKELDKENSTLENVEIKGNLTISKKVKEVKLKKVKVNGTIYVEGGTDNSIYFEDCDLKDIIVDKKDDKKVRLVAEGDTTVGKVTLKKLAKGGAILEEKSLKKAGFDDVVINDANTVTLKGEFDDVDVDVSNAEVAIESGKIDDLNIKSGAKDARVEIASSVKVATLSINAKSTIKGKGTVEKATISADGVSISSDVKVEKKVNNSTIKITVDKTKLTEATANDGSLSSGVLVVKLSNGTFSSNIKSSDVTINNKPEGMDYTVKRDSDTQITITLTGKAKKHANSNDISNLSITIDKDKINEATSDLKTDNISIDFKDPVVTPPVTPEQPKPEVPKPETPVTPEQPKPEVPKPETPVTPEQPKPEVPKPETPETPATPEQPKPEIPKPETPVTPEQPKPEEPKPEAPVTPEQPKSEETKPEAPALETPAVP